MAKVKIELEKGETLEKANEDLFKALNHDRSGDSHTTESFDDPAMVDLSRELFDQHKKIYQDMIQEITEAIDQEHFDGN